MFSQSSNFVSRVLSSSKLGNFKYLFLLLLVFLVMPSRSFGQTATIVGTVTDPQGGAVAGVTITITNSETSAVRTLTTNESGQYVAPDLILGHYSVKASSSGFKVAERKDIVLQVGDRLRVDFQMVIGAASETVTVEANAIAVQADSGEVSNVITGEQIANLSINGRGIYQLAALAPGASSQIDVNAPNTPVGGSASR
jgi:uncharacterized cupredoxin-like copper-binding protein